MPVILMMTDQGEGDKFRFVDDGRPRAGAENYTTYAPGQWPEEYDDEAMQYREPGSQPRPQRQGAIAMLGQGANADTQWYPRADTNPSARAQAAGAAGTQPDPNAERRAFLQSIRDKAEAGGTWYEQAPAQAAGGARVWSQDLQSSTPQPRSAWSDYGEDFRWAPVSTYRGSGPQAYLPVMRSDYNPQEHAAFRESLAGNPDLDQAVPQRSRRYLPYISGPEADYTGVGQVGVNPAVRYTGEQAWAPTGSGWGDAYAMQERGSLPDRIPGPSTRLGAATAVRPQPTGIIPTIEVVVPPYDSGARSYLGGGQGRLAWR